jgi:membrane protease YdiL (CAAX protease family)
VDKKQLDPSDTVQDGSPVFSSPGKSPGFLSKIFFNPRGLRSGWRLLVFIGIVYFEFQIILIAVPRGARLATASLAPVSMLLREALFLLVVLVAAGIMAVFEKRSLADYFLPWRAAFQGRFWWGGAWGFLALSALLLVIRAGHGFFFGHVALAGSKIPYDAMIWALVFIVVGLTEEFTFRGYPLYTLSTGIGFWPAAILVSAAFGAVHLGNPGEDWAGAVAAGLIGLFFCFTVRRTGSLWFAVGLHGAWDYSETFLYSVPNSGLVAKGHLLSSSFHGARWLTGGSVGPEGSVFVFVVIGILFVVFNYMYPKARVPQHL